jgi:hypothetical protein
MSRDRQSQREIPTISNTPFEEWCAIPEQDRYHDGSLDLKVLIAESNSQTLTREMKEYRAFLEKHNKLVLALPLVLLTESKKYVIQEFGYSVERVDWIGHDLINIKILVRELPHGVVTLGVAIASEDDAFLGYRFRASALSWNEFQKAIKAVESAIKQECANTGKIFPDVPPPTAIVEAPIPIIADAEEEQPLKCLVCMDRTANTLVEPCGHSVVCKECSQGLESTPNKTLCIMCRTPIVSIWQTK